MYKIKTLNVISPVIHDHLAAETYEVGNNVDQPDAILVRSADCHDLEFTDNLLAVARAGAGVNNIPIDACTAHGVAVFNTPGANANAVKELLLAAMLFTSRNMLPAMEWVQTLKGKGDEIPALVEKGKKQFVGPELKGKTLGIVGLGAIGVMAANDALSIGMDVVSYDPYISIENAWGVSRSVKRAPSLESLVSQSDFVTMHVPFTKNTDHMFTEDIIRRMKPGSTLINFSRDPLVDIAAVKKALETGRLNYYITDFPNDEVLGHERIIAIPHLGASTPEAEENCAHMAAIELDDYIRFGNIRNSVNLPNCELRVRSPYRLAILHKNVTNMVGQITGILARYDINISDMINKSRGDLAYTLIGMDHALPEAAMEALRTIEGTLRIRSFAY